MKSYINQQVVVMTRFARSEPRRPLIIHSYTYINNHCAMCTRLDVGKYCECEDFFFLFVNLHKKCKFAVEMTVANEAHLLRDPAVLARVTLAKPTKLLN